MKVIQKRMLLQIVLGFLLGRVNLFGINPIGVAFFAAGYTEEGAKLSVGISVILGMLTVFSMEKVLSSAMAMLAVVLAVDLLEKKKLTVRMGHTALLLCAAVGFLNMFRLYLMPHDQYDVWMAFLETVLVLAAVRILHDGIHFLLYARKGQSLGNEEGISLVLLGALGVLGLPDIMIAQVSVILTVVYFLTLLMGYCYGTGTGAAAGAIGGCVLVLCGWESSMIGILALMGICAGMLREQGRLLLCAGFFLLAFVLGSTVNQSVMGMGELEGIAIAGGVFLLIPERFLGKIRIHAGGWQDDWESEKLQKLMKYKLKDFSQSFQNLSASLAKNSEEENRMNTKDVERLMEAMPQQGCSACRNYENYLHAANMAMGFQNKMAQNQRVIASQMKEVGDIMGELSEKLPVIQKLPVDLQDRIEKELRKRRVLITELAFYEKYDGRLEIHLRGRTSRGRFVTTREVGETISAVLGCKVLPCEECRKVFPREDEEFVFEECAKLTAVTGISRMPKAGEEISGDTFSCMYLPSGELLMALSDGMGTGDSAYEESEQVIELLEQMTEAGFSESSAIRLINSIYMAKEEERSFATADVAVLNLYQESCHFVKCGACTTYLYHQGEMLRVEGEALPIGVMSEMEPYLRKSGITAGDYVIMMTDGVADSFLEEQEGLEEYLQKCMEKRLSPQDMADCLLDEAAARWDMEPVDDMSVMVVRVYENTDRRLLQTA